MLFTLWTLHCVFYYRINLFLCIYFLNKTFTKIINTARTAVGYLSDSQKLTVVISLYYYYTVSVKDIQHLS